MEAVWDRKPTDEVIDALWLRSVDILIQAARQRSVGNAAVGNADAMLKARIAAAAVQIDYRRTYDNDAATEVLLHLKSPRGAERLDKTIAQLQKDAADAAEKKVNIVATPYNEGARNLNRLIDLYRTPLAVDYLLKNLDSEIGTRQQFNINNKQIFVSNRTSALATLILISGQKPEDFKLGPANNIWYSQWAAGSEADESAAIEKIKKWYAEHKDEKLPEKPTNTDGVKPGAAGALPPGVVPGINVAPANVVPVPAVIKGGVQIQGRAIQVDGNAVKVEIQPVAPVVAPAPAPK
jgi:hypothetical protein